MRNTLAFSLCSLLGAIQVEGFGNINLDAVAAVGIQKRQNPSATPPFDAKAQLVSTSGIHAFVAPGPNDLRGPCPGLNALANHGYLPHSGLATIVDFVIGTYEAVGMAGDLSTILAVYGALLDGQLVSWSIGGGPHIGIGGSHNNYETDSSPLRGDLYQYGSNTRLVMSQFQTLYDMQPDAATANYDLTVLKEFRGLRFNESIAKNPSFYYAPFSGVVVSQAAFVFIYRFFANKSEEYPSGLLNKEVLKSFMSITGPEDNLTWVPGHERIPDNWYKRNDKDQYSLEYLGADSSNLAKGQEFINVPGCNTGKVNSYTPIDTADLSGGAYGPAAVLADPLCFGLAFATASVLNAPLAPAGNLVQELILPIQNALGCVTIPSLNTSVGQGCPGYSLYDGPTAKVAPGAIQT